MKNNHKQLQDIISSIADEYYLDFYLPDYKIASGVNLSDRNKLIENTFSLILNIIKHSMIKESSLLSKICMN